MRNKHIILGIVLVVALLVMIGASVNEWRSPVTLEDRAFGPMVEVQIGQTLIQVAVADEAHEQTQGLSGITALADNEGVLFTYTEPQNSSFWMKDMHFPIDIIWIDEHKEVVGIEHTVSPDTYPQTFTPPVPVQYVLEVNAGWAEEHSIQTGDHLILKAAR